MDFDSTLALGYPNISKQSSMHKLVLWYCKYNQRIGNIVILNTLRKDDPLYCKYNHIIGSITMLNPPSNVKDNTLTIALEYLNGKNFIPDYVNRNTVE